MNNKLIPVVLLLSILCSPAFAARSFFYETPETLAMGSVAIATAKNHQIAFSNPAILALHDNTGFSVLNGSIAFNSDYDDMKDKLSSLSNQDTAASRSSNYSKISQIMGKTGYRSWSNMAYYLSQAGFAITAGYIETEKYSVANPSNPVIRSEIDKDAILSGSIAHSFNENHVLFKDRATGWWGATMRFISRNSTTTSYYSRDFAALTGKHITETDLTGAGLDFDLGALWQLNNPWNTSIGLFVGNLLGSEISSEIGRLKRAYGVGVSIRPLTGSPERNERLLLAADFLHRNEDDFAGLARLRMGAKYKVSRHLDLMAGLRGGYATAGLSINWQDLKIQAATYAQELGRRPGDMEDRRHSVSATLEF